MGRQRKHVFQYTTTCMRHFFKLRKGPLVVNGTDGERAGPTWIGEIKSEGKQTINATFIRKTGHFGF